MAPKPVPRPRRVSPRHASRSPPVVIATGRNRIRARQARGFFRIPRRIVDASPRTTGLLLAHHTPMRFIPSPFKAHVAVLTSLSLIGSSIAPLIAAQAPKAAAKTAPAAAAPVDGGWPRSMTTASGAALTLYQPQIASWTDQKHVVAYSAVSYIAKGAAKPALGTLKVEADTGVAVEQRLVNFSNLKIVSRISPRSRASSCGRWWPTSASPCRSSIRSSRSIASWPTSIRARSSRRTSRA